MNTKYYKLRHDDNSDCKTHWRWFIEVDHPGNKAGFKTSQEGLIACSEHMELIREEERNHIADWFEKCVKDHPSGWSAKMISNNIREGCKNNLEDMPDPQREFRRNLSDHVMDAIHLLSRGDTDLCISRLTSLLARLESKEGS